MRLLTGEPIHDFYRSILKDSFPDYGMAESEVSLQLYHHGVPLGAPVLGHIDGYIESLKATVEVKSVGRHVYGMVTEKGAPLDPHLFQGNLYTGCVEGAESTLFIYHCRDSGQYTTFLVPFIKSLFDEVCDKFTSARVRQVLGVMAPRPYQDATQSPCSFCEYKDECYEGFAKEIETFEEAYAEGDDLIMALEYISLRDTRLGAEKNEVEMKKALIKEMSNKKISNLRTARGALTLSAGKNNNSLLSFKESKP